MLSAYTCKRIKEHLWAEEVFRITKMKIDKIYILIFRNHLRTEKLAFN